MKKFEIPLIEKTFYIYVGKDEWEKYKKDVIKEGGETKPDALWPGKNAGQADGGWIWIDNTKDKNLIYHELSHLIDDVMVLINTKDREFRAFITAWVNDTVLKWSNNAN